MKREFLKGLNLDDATIDKVLDEHSRHIGAEVSKTTAANAAKVDLEAQLTQRDKDLSDLKKAAEGNETLTKQLGELQEQSKAAKTAYENTIKTVQMQSAIKLALAGKVHDAGIVGGLIDQSTIELDADGNIKGGLDKQLETLSKDKAFLFLPDTKQTDGKPAGFKPAEGSGGSGAGGAGGGGSLSLSDAVAAALGGTKT